MACAPAGHDHELPAANRGCDGPLARAVASPSSILKTVTDFNEPSPETLEEIELGSRAAWSLGVWNEWRNPRVCGGCDQLVWPDGPDPCLGWLPGVEYACCGHGEKCGMVQFTNGLVIRFDYCLVDGVHLVKDVDENNIRILRRVEFGAA